MQDYLQDRVETLQSLSGLRVTVREEKGQNVFEFFHGKESVKTCFTYDKAKLFAEGIEFVHRVKFTQETLFVNMPLRELGYVFELPTFIYMSRDSAAQDLLKGEETLTLAEAVARVILSHRQDA
jgi:hypothetical protein